MSSQPDSPAAKTWTSPPANLQEAIRRRAEEIYFRNGRAPNRDKENWAQAEREILHEFSASHGTRKAVIVKVNGVQYVGEYDSGAAGGYVPGELSSGAPIPVRFAGDKMFVRRPNGRELETRIVETTPVEKTPENKTR